MLRSLTKKKGQQCPQHFEISLQVAGKKLAKGRPCRSSMKNYRNCINISLAQRSVEWECQGHISTIKRRSTSSGLSLNESTGNGNRGQGEASGGIERLLPVPMISLMNVGKEL